MVKMNDTPTPRTDAIIAKHDHILQYTDLLNYCKDMTANSVQLERELADMTKQRDALAEALESLCTAIISGHPREITGLLKQSGLALAATKGGQHE
jgi:hypothetical protein